MKQTTSSKQPSHDFITGEIVRVRVDGKMEEGEVVGFVGDRIIVRCFDVRRKPCVPASQGRR